MSGSKIYREIRQQDIERIIMDYHGSGARLISSKILNGGLFNTTYLLHTNREEYDLVLRVGPVNRHLLFEFEKDMMAAEPVFHKLLQDHGIPTSRVLKYSPANAVIDREYILAEYIPSVPMNDESLRDADLGSVYEELGVLTNRIHRIQGEKFGWLRPGGGWGLHDTWSGFITAFAAEAADKAEEYELFSKEEIRTFRAIVAENRETLDEITVPRYIHSDLWQGNILLTGDRGRWRIAAIIDLDRTIWGDKYWDFSTPWITNDLFFRGYGEPIDRSESYMLRQTLYKLLGGFFGSYVCLVEYDDREWFRREQAQVSSLLAAYCSRG